MTIYSTLSHALPKIRLPKYTRQTPSDSSQIKIVIELQNNITKL